jgi:uncharacterized membrane protein
MKPIITGICRVMFQRETLAPVLTLGAVSAIAVALVSVRVAFSRDLRQAYLIWNLFLAWLPLFFCLASVRVSQAVGRRHWKFWALAASWLLFLPNAPYIFTDLIHLGPRGRPHFWVDLVLILLCAWTAALLGFVSLYVMQRMVSRRFGSVGGWAFVLLISGLTGVGICMGRFMRWNSWDLILNPIGVALGVCKRAIYSADSHHLAVYAALFALLFFAAHVTLSGLLHLRLQNPEGAEHQ